MRGKDLEVGVRPAVEPQPPQAIDRAGLGGAGNHFQIPSARRNATSAPTWYAV